jgi:hypothetical protein
MNKCDSCATSPPPSPSDSLLVSRSVPALALESGPTRTGSRLLTELETIKTSFGVGKASHKLELLRTLEHARLASAPQVTRLHEALCFLRAYPDDPYLLAQVERMLVGFSGRADLRRHKRKLADSGIAGTDLYYPFFAPTARWLVQRWRNQLSVDWSWFKGGKLLKKRLPLLALYSETPGLDELDMPVRKWVGRLKAPNETDAEFLVRRFERVGGNPFESEAIYEEIGLTLRLAAGPNTPSRTLAKLNDRPIHFQTTPLRRERPDVRREVAKPPLAVRAVSEHDGARIIDRAREAMVTRSRDLDAFMHGDPLDVRMVDCGGGLEFACIGMHPERRLLLESVYAFLTLMNRVPIGYVLTSALFQSSEIAYNVFDSWRGGEAGHVYGRVLAMTRHLFGSDTFTIYPYQLGGEGNTEGLKSGAWWFYQKLGFRARERQVLALMENELGKIRRDPSHRSDNATLKRLAKQNVFFSLGRERDDVIGLFPLAKVGLAITDALARRFGSDRERGERVCAGEAAKLCGPGDRKSWSANERLAWQRWSPLILILPGIESWTPGERAALIRVVRAKGGRRESDFVRLFDGHRRLRAALRRLVAKHGD